MQQGSRDIKMSKKLSREKLLKANRRNSIEGVRLGFRLDDFDKEKRLVTKYIEQEKKTLKTTFENVKRTTGNSEEGRKSKDDKLKRNSILTKNGIELSERRLSQWRVCEKQLKKIISLSNSEKANSTENERKYVTRPASVSQIDNEIPRLDDLNSRDFNGNLEMRPVSNMEDDVFITQKTRRLNVNGHSENIQDLGKHSNMDQTITSSFEARVRPQSEMPRIMPRQHSRKINIRPTSAYPVKKRPINGTYVSRKQSYSRIEFTHDETSLNENFRPVSAYPVKKRSISEGYRPNSRKQTCNRTEITQSDSSLIKDEKAKEDGDRYDVNANSRPDEIDVISNVNRRSPVIADVPFGTLGVMGDTTKHIDPVEKPIFVNPNVGPQDIVSKWEILKRPRPASEDPTLRLAEIRRSKAASSSGTSVDTSGNSANQGKAPVSAKPNSRQARVSWAEESEDEKNGQLNWRELVHTKSGAKVLTNMASVGKVLQAAMAFSKIARQKALEKMVEKKSMDGHELVRQERLRRLHSRASLLKDLANQWHSHSSGLNQNIDDKIKLNSK